MGPGFLVPGNYPPLFPARFGPRIRGRGDAANRNNTAQSSRPYIQRVRGKALLICFRDLSTVYWTISLSPFQGLSCLSRGYPAFAEQAGPWGRPAVPRPSRPRFRAGRGPGRPGPGPSAPKPCPRHTFDRPLCEWIRPGRRSPAGTRRRPQLQTKMPATARPGAIRARTCLREIRMFTPPPSPESPGRRS